MIKVMMLLMSVFAASNGLTLTSHDFPAGGNIPTKFTCEGANISPSLHIDDLPPTTASLAIIMHDPDAPMAGGFTHWVAWNIQPAQEIPENFKGGEQGLNGAGKPGYTGPCPPSGTHHYHFMVYALDTQLKLDKNTDKAGLEKAMQGHILLQGDLIGLYKKVK